MGKGSRNRQYRVDDKVQNPKKYKKTAVRKPAPKWLAPFITALILVAILVGVVAISITNSGTIQRNRVLVKSESGKFDLTESMAAYLIFSQSYYQGYYYYLYYGSSLGLTEYYDSADTYAFLYARYAAVEDLRNSIETMKSELIAYVAACDLAYKDSNYDSLLKLNDTDLESIDDSYTWLNELFVSNNSNSYTYSYNNFKSFLQKAVGKGVNKATIKAMDKIALLYSKYTTYLTVNHEDYSDEEIEKYILENANSYYKMSYLSYVIENVENDALGTGLPASMTKDDFVKYAYDNSIYAAAYDDVFVDDTTNKDTYKTYIWEQYKNNVYSYFTDADLTENGSYTKDSSTTDVITSYFKEKLSTLDATEDKNTYILVTDTEKETVNEEEVSHAITYAVKITDITSTTENEVTTITGVTYSYKKYSDDKYFALYSAITSEDDLGVTTTADSYVTLYDEDATDKDEVLAWLSENEVTETPYNRTFTRADGDTKYVYDATEKTCTIYCVTSKPATDLDKTIVGNGGYLLYKTEADATAAKATLEGITDPYALYYAFSKLSIESLNTDGETTTTNATMSTSIKDVDDNLNAFFASETGLKVVANKAGDGWYLAYSISHGESYKLEINSTLISNAINDKLEEVAANYTIAEKTLNKIGEKATEAETETETETA